MNSLVFLQTFVVACLGTLIATPAVKVLARACGAMDKPNARKVHKVPTPLWGGIGVFAAAVVAVLLTIHTHPEFTTQIVAKQWSHLQGMLIASAMMLIIGMIDDRYNMPAKVKLFGQIATAAVMMKHGIRIEYLSVPGSEILYLYDWQSYALTGLWIVGITNAINLLDGLDGLVAGVTMGSSLVFSVVSVFHGQWLVAVVMAAIAGAALGFLKYNFNPASIFIGDTGALVLGLNFAGWSTVGCLKTTVSLALAIPILVMAVPIFDTCFAIVRRAANHRPIFSPDKEHLHHRLLATGLSQKQTVVCIYAINMAFGLAGIALAWVAR